MFKNAARKIAHNTTMPGLAGGLAGKQDLRALQDLITAEKTVLNSCVMRIDPSNSTLMPMYAQTTTSQCGLRQGVRGASLMGTGRRR